jgi:hypothetical protein
MAVCSLVSGRARDGALYTTRWRREELLEPPSEAFYVAAKDSLPRDLAAAKGMNYMRACAILAIASIQNGQIKNMQKYSGMYHTLMTMEGFHDEKLWPKNISPIEVEERRRLVRACYFSKNLHSANRTKVLVNLHSRYLLNYRMGRRNTLSRGPIPRTISHRSGRPLHHRTRLYHATRITSIKHNQPEPRLRRLKAIIMLDARVELHNRLIPDPGACCRRHKAQILLGQRITGSLVSFQPCFHV